MKRSRFHEEALRATSRITGLGLVLSCAPSTDTGTSEPKPAATTPGPSAGPETTTSESVAESAPAAGTEAAESAAPTEAAEAAEVAEPIDPTDTPELAQCRAVTTAAFDDKRAIRPGVDVAEVERCCSEIAISIDARLNEGVDLISAWTERNACCNQLGWGGSIACTPWGPTAPPPGSGEHVARLPFGDGILDLRGQAQVAGARHGLTSAALEPALSRRTREAAIATWRGRMINESVSARVFESVARRMGEAGFDAAIVDEWAGFADEERSHGVLCGAVVEALGGEAVASVPVLPEVPVHPDVSPRLAVLRNVLSISALSETVAVALIGAERMQMGAGSPLHGLLTRIWADEIGHANAGWRLLRAELAADDGTIASDLARYLPTALDDLIEHELVHLPVDFIAPDDGDRWGLCDGVEARSLFADTLTRVVGPALEELLGAPVSLPPGLAA